MKSCRSVTGHPGGNATWRAHHIRLTKSFKCRDARQNIKTWIDFGGTKPMRTYRLRFRIKNL